MTNETETYKRWLRTKVVIPATVEGIEEFVKDFVGVNDRKLVIEAIESMVHDSDSSLRSAKGFGEMCGFEECSKSYEQTARAYKNGAETLRERYKITGQDIQEYKEKLREERIKLGYAVPFV